MFIIELNSLFQSLGDVERLVFITYSFILTSYIPYLFVPTKESFWVYFSSIGSDRGVSNRVIHLSSSRVHEKLRFGPLQPSFHSIHFIANGPNEISKKVHLISITSSVACKHHIIYHHAASVCHALYSAVGNVPQPPRSQPRSDCFIRLLRTVLRHFNNSFSVGFLLNLFVSLCEGLKQNCEPNNVIRYPGGCSKVKMVCDFGILRSLLSLVQIRKIFFVS